MTADSIVDQWATLNAAAGPVAYEASTYSSSLECEAWTGPTVEDAEIVRCFFQGGHSCPGFGYMPQMMWDFARRHPKQASQP